MKSPRDPQRLDSLSDSEVDVELARALKALAQDRPSPQELARVRSRLEATLDQQVAARAQVLLLQPAAGLIVVAAALLSMLPSPERFASVESRVAPAAERCGTASANAGREIGPGSSTTAAPRLDGDVVAPEPHAPEPVLPSRIRTDPSRHGHRSERIKSMTEGLRSHASSARAAGAEAGRVDVAPEPSFAVAAAQRPADMLRAEGVAPHTASVEPQVDTVETVAPDEVTLLQRARMQTREPRAALRWLDEHKRLYPRGALTQEREVLAIQLLRALSRDGAAEQRFQAFRRDFPRSIYLPRLSAAEPHE